MEIELPYDSEIRNLRDFYERASPGMDDYGRAKLCEELASLIEQRVTKMRDFSGLLSDLLNESFVEESRKEGVKEFLESYSLAAQRQEKLLEEFRRKQDMGEIPRVLH